MKLWTIQPIERYEELLANGVIRSGRGYAWDCFISAYEWMMLQMEEFMPRPDPECEFPIWAWYQYSNAKKKRPDLRRIGHLEKGTPGVRIEFEVANDSVLLSDFELWHYVLNYWYLPASVQDEERFSKRLESKALDFHRMKPLPDEDCHRDLRASWQRIFDLHWFQEEYCHRLEQKAIQATVWEVRLESVTSVQKFIAR